MPGIAKDREITGLFAKLSQQEQIEANLARDTLAPLADKSEFVRKAFFLGIKAMYDEFERRSQIEIQTKKQTNFPKASQDTDIKVRFAELEAHRVAHPERFDEEIGYIDMDPEKIEAERARRGLPPRGEKLPEAKHA